jgi:transposase
MRKSDSIDSRRLARALASQSITGCYIPSREEEGFRAMCRFRVQLARDQARVKNRIKSLLDFQGVKIPGNDELTHWSGAFIQYLRELPQGNEHIRETLRRLIEELLELRRQLADLMKHLKTVVLKDQKKTAIIKRLAGILQRCHLETMTVDNRLIRKFFQSEIHQRNSLIVFLFGKINIKKKRISINELSCLLT